MMPKIVDQEERKQIVAEAVWAVVARLGLKGATIRTVADECGMSVGSIQHYFSSQNDLYRFSMNLMVERASKRMDLLGVHEPQTDIEAIGRILEVMQQLLPLDQERHTEAQTWLAFSVEAISNKDLKGLQERMGQLIRGACLNCLSYLEHQNILVVEAEIDYETERLYALMDGLALHLTIDPSHLAEEQAQDLLRKHILSLVDPRIFKASKPKNPS